MDEKMETSYETIAEKLKKQLGYKVGILSSVNLNHATPAAFYAHQASRNNYYEIGQELIASNFDYFAGGGLKKTTGSEGDQTDLYELAQEAGYKVIKDVYKRQLWWWSDAWCMVYGDGLRYKPHYTKGAVCIWRLSWCSYRNFPYFRSFRRGRFLCDYFLQPAGTSD